MTAVAPLEPTGAERLRVRGAVQGVGFRPFVWQAARTHGLAGWVLNDQEGVLIHVEGSGDALAAFERSLRSEAPPLSRIDSVERNPARIAGFSDFVIEQSSRDGSSRTMVTPDAATCPDCLADVFDPDGRRYLYPFTNCTHCGPRYTITRSLPYDRSETSMAPFPMCSACEAEYNDPADRRFHAQPNACPACGPRLSMPVEEVVKALKAGRIVAVKGLGGYHLACDARREDAVETLRLRKNRDGKPFAVMVAGLPSAGTIAEIKPLEAELLSSRAAPIVVCRALPDNGIAQAVSAGLPTLGLMLPYTPLHALLFHAAAGSPDGTSWMEEPQEFVLVMTSANPGGEPLVIDDEDAGRRLAGIADVIVRHDRTILTRCDDSVMRVIAGAPAYLRRSRGAAPEPIRLSCKLPPTIAFGAHLKTTVCVIRDDEAFLSEHVGSLDNLATFEALRQAAEHLTALLDVTPEHAACDLHPDLLSTRLAEDTGLPLVRVQHHHAHIAAVLAEHGIEEATLGLALDGFGLAADGQSSWGGELMTVHGPHFEHLASLAPLAQPGGDRAAREPWRMAAAALHTLGRGDEIAARFGAQEGAALIAAMLDRGVNAPPTSSCGRLFDAAAGLLGVRSHSRFEGDAAMALEALVRRPCVLEGGWRIRDDGFLDLYPLLSALIDCDPSSGADVFHGTLAEALAEWAFAAIGRGGLPPIVAAGGGCMQNSVLAESLTDRLESRGVRLLLPRKAPANDGGLSLGQAVVAALKGDG